MEVVEKEAALAVASWAVCSEEAMEVSASAVAR
jgi:hypothetical protein